MANECDFEISYSRELDEAKEIISTEITDNDGEIQIDDNNQGSFTISVPGGDVAGDVTFNSNVIAVSITEKPTFIPCNIIRSVIESYLE